MARGFIPVGLRSSPKSSECSPPDKTVSLCFGTASQPSGDKSPRHRGGFDQSILIKPNVLSLISGRPHPAPDLPTTGSTQSSAGPPCAICRREPSRSNARSLSMAGPSSRVSPGSEGRMRSLWRGSLLPLGREAVLKPDIAVFQENSVHLLWVCCAAQREQAPSPRGGACAQVSRPGSPALPARPKAPCAQPPLRAGMKYLTDEACEPAENLGRLNPITEGQ